MRRLRGLLGGPGLVIGAVSVLALVCGLIVLVREYDELQRVGREALQPALAEWARTEPVDYLRRTLPDLVDRRAAVPSTDLDRPLAALGESGRRGPLVAVVGLELVGPRGERLASWRPRPEPAASADDRVARVELPTTPPSTLAVRHRLAEGVSRVAQGLVVSYHRLLLALAGLSGYPLLCLAYMALQARALRDRAAHEAAQAATLAMADRTCHELGNVAFVLANERRNFAEGLDLLSRGVDEDPAAMEAAAARAGIDPTARALLSRSLARERAARGLDPERDLRPAATLAAQAGRQVAVCAEYIALTVRELDAYLRRSELEVVSGPTDLTAVVDDALALLAPALEAADARIERPGGPPTTAWADRRLLVHALVNLLKNAVEASPAGGVVALDARAVGGGRVQLRVADRGPGIDPARLRGLFHVGGSTKGPGRGRGLAIALDAVRSQGGTLQFEPREGGGSTFVVELPTGPTPRTA